MQMHAARSTNSTGDLAETPISAATNRQLNSIGRLQDLLGTLEDKLSPVLAADRAGGEKGNIEAPVSNVALVQVLDGNTDRVDAACAVVISLLDRLAV